MNIAAIKKRCIEYGACIIITNGRKTFICRRTDTGYGFIDTLPKYEEIV